MANEFYVGQLVRKRHKLMGEPLRWYVGEVIESAGGGGLFYSIKLLHLETHHPNGKITHTPTLQTREWWNFIRMEPHDVIERLAGL